MTRRFRRTGSSAVNAAARDERGSITPLIIGFVLVAAALVLVVIDATALFLGKRALGTTADGAALAAAQEIDEDRIYAEGGITDRDLPLLQSAARQAVGDYLELYRGTPSHEALTGFDVTVADDRVTVVLHGHVRLPATSFLPEFADGVAVSHQATAVLRCREDPCE